MNKKEEYLNLLSKTYDEAVEILRQKYGQVKDDYFKEKSYERFFKGEIKKPGTANYSRFKEGLVCHHVAENKFLNMSNTFYIKDQKIPFEYQKKDRLVYCDYLEHLILHALISKETNGNMGAPGYDTYLMPTSLHWYIFKENIPKTKWLACYKKAWLKPEEAFEVLKAADNIAYGRPSTILAYPGIVRHFPETFEELEKIKQEYERIKREKEKVEKKRIEERERLEKEKPIAIERAKNINEDSSAHEIIETLYKLESIVSQLDRLFPSNFCGIHFEESMDNYESRMSEYVTDELLKELKLIIQYGNDVIGRNEFQERKNKNPKTKKMLESEKAFDSKYPYLQGTIIDCYSDRQTIAAELYKRKYKNEYNGFIGYQKAIKNKNKESLLAELNALVSN